MIRRVYGDTDEAGALRAREVCLLIPRGARKTSTAAAIALAHLCGPENRPGGELIFAASSREQAKVAFGEVLGIIEATPALAALLRVRDADNRAEVLHRKSGSVLRAISAEAGQLHGATPTFILADEGAQWGPSGARVWEALRSGTVKVPGAMTWRASTAGRGTSGWFVERAAAARAAAEIEARGERNETGIVPVLFETTAEADWRDEAVWRAVNPGLAEGFPDLDAMRQLARDAESSLFQRALFRQHNLNLWQDAQADPFVEMAIYDEGSDPIGLETLRDRPCWIGVDLGKSFDMTAVVAAWKDDDGGFTVWPWYFAPGDRVDERTRREGIPYAQWVEDGHLIASPGSVIDEALVEETIRDLCRRFTVRQVGFDPAFAARMMARLADDGIPVVECPQRWSFMGPATRTLQEAIVGRRLRHGGHPILRWNVENIAVVYDKNGDAQMHKGKSRDHIDGAVAAAMAVQQASLAADAPSLYDLLDSDPDLFILR